MTDSIIEKVNNILCISHRIISDNTDNKEVSIRNLINKHRDKFELFGTLHFQNERVVNNGKGEQPITYFLNEPQATLLLTFMRNNETIINFKVHLVQEFYKMKNLLENPLKKRTEDLEFAGRQFEVFEKTFFKIGITKKEELAITSNRAVKNETEIDFLVLAGKEGIETDVKFQNRYGTL